jgi:ATP-dependent RNA helicase DDX24/MAK5
VTGGLSLQKQKRLLRNADVIIGTPGRLWEVIQGDDDLAQWLKMLSFLVVDEADRLLSEGHFKEVEEILNALDRKDSCAEIGSDCENGGDEQDQRQTLVFSATFQRDLQQKLAGKGKSLGGDLMNKQESMEYLLKKLNFRGRKPKFIDVDPVSQMASGLKEGILECGGLEKVYPLLPCERRVTEYSLGPLSLRHSTTPSKYSDVNLHQLDRVGTSSYPFSPKPGYLSLCVALSNAPKSPTSLH